MKRRRVCRLRRGVAYLVALLMLAIFSALGIALATISNSNLAMTRNLRSSSDALLAAESGMSFANALLGSIRLPATTTQATFLTNLQTALGSKLNGTSNLAGQTVRIDSTCVYIPPIPIEGRTFQCWIGWVADKRARLTVRGTVGAIHRDVAMDYSLVRRLAGAFDYGLASKGRITLTKGSVLGVTDPQDANVLSATESYLESILVSNTVSGDLSAAGKDHYIAVGHGANVAGHGDMAGIAEHLHFGVEAPDFPEIDVSPMWEIVKNNQASKKDNTFTNAYLPAGSKVNITGGATINGILYIQPPCDIKFAGNLVIRGMIVVGPGGNVSNTTIDFRGTVDSYSVTTLPDTPQYAAVRQMTGTFIAAPGCAVSFGGNVGTINGAIAAGQLTWFGSASGTIKGSMIQLEDLPTSINCNGPIYIDRQNADPDPAGFGGSLGFSVIPDSYRE